VTVPPATPTRTHPDGPVPGLPARPSRPARGLHRSPDPGRGRLVSTSSFLASGGAQAEPGFGGAEHPQRLADATLLELEHASVTTEIEVDGQMVDVLLNDPGSGLWGLGAGWEMGLVALDALVRRDAPDPAAARPTSRAQARSLAEQSSRAWAQLLAAR